MAPGSDADVRNAALPAQLLERALDTVASPIVVFEHLASGCAVRYVNRALARGTGYSAEQFRQIGWDALHVEGPRDADAARLLAAIREGREFEIPIRIRRKDGIMLSADLHVTPFTDGGAGPPAFAVGVLHARSASREYLRHLEHDARHDPLTGLPNRRLLAEHARSAVARSVRENRPLAIALVDLDGFKAVNDKLGHAAGDEVLRTIAARFARELRPSDFIARLGGDEFVLVLADVGGDISLASLIERIRAHIERPIHLQGQGVTVSCSIGVAVCPEHGADADALLRYADRAMYRQKRLRRAAPAPARMAHGVLNRARIAGETRPS